MKSTNILLLVLLLKNVSKICQAEDEMAISVTGYHVSSLIAEN